MNLVNRCRALASLACLAATMSCYADHPWNKEVFYQIFPRSFRDSNGDGIGDFNGITQGLGYLKDLGVTAVLINPIFKARVYHNYFADDFFSPDPGFGTMDEWKSMVKAAHKHGIKVVLDIEPQYCASGFPWLADAMKDPKSKYRDYFTNIPTGKGPHWYNHVEAPISTLNFQKQECRDFVHEFCKFWADTGIDGMRIDHMMDNLDNNPLNTGLFKNLWAPVEKEVKEFHPGFFFVAEQADWEGFSDVVHTFDHTPTDAVFGFRARTSLMSWNKIRIQKQLQEGRYFGRPDRTVLNFIENHDMERWASSQSDERKQRLGAVFMCTTEGTPILYYGQEIGMKGIQGDWHSDGNDIPVRLGFRWKAKLNSPETPRWYKGTGPWDDPAFSTDHDGISVEEQEHQPDSLLNFYRKLIKIRQSHPALMHGEQEVVTNPNPDLVIYRRKLAAEEVVVVMNLSDRVQMSDMGKAGTDLWTGKAIRTQLRVEPFGFAVLFRKS